MLITVKNISLRIIWQILFNRVWFFCYAWGTLSVSIFMCSCTKRRIIQVDIHTSFICSTLHPVLECLFQSVQYSPWCQNRGCSYISSRRRIYRSNPAVPCIFPRREEDSVSVQSAIGSRVFRAVLPDRIFILSGSKALQAPHVHFPVLPSILPSRNSAKLGIPVMTFAAIPLKNSRSNLAEFEYYCLHCVLGRNVWQN